MSSKGLSYSKDFYRKDFGLGQHRLALPDQVDSRHAGGAAGGGGRKKKKSIGGRVKELFRKTSSSKRESSSQPSFLDGPQQRAESPRLASNHEQQQPAAAGSRPRTPQQLTRPRTPQQRPRTPQQQRPRTPQQQQQLMRPSPLHSRVLTKENFGSHTSLENILNEYGLKKDGTPILSRKRMQPSDNLIRLTLISANEDEEHRVTLRKRPDGFGIHLSGGPPPVTVTLVEPGSEGMNAGVKEGDVIVEVNGKDCRTMEALPLSELMELKSLIQHIPSSIGSARKFYDQSHLPVTAIDSSSTESSSSSSESGDYSSMINVSNQRRKKRITKGVWNRIKAEGLVDSDSDSNSSFVNLPVTAIESSDEEEQPWPDESPVVIDEDEWRRMKQQQNLIFNSDAPSNMISSSSSNQQLHREDHSAAKKKLFKFPFGKSPHHYQGGNNIKGDVDRKRYTAKSPLESVQVAPKLNFVDDVSSESDTTDRPPIMERATVEPRKPNRPTRSNSVIVPKTVSENLTERKKRFSKEAPPDLSIVERTTPLLGGRAGRDRRNVARARHARKPTTKQLSAPATSAADKDTKQSSVSTSGTQLKSHQLTTASDSRRPGSAAEPRQTLQRQSSAALVEQALRKRHSISELPGDGEQSEEQKLVSSKQRKLATATAHGVHVQPEGITAQVVAHAAASKARLRRHESLEKRDSKPTVKPKSQLMHQSRSFQHEKGSTDAQPAWISVAKTKHEKMADEYTRVDTLNRKKSKGTRPVAGFGTQSYSDYLLSTAVARQKSVATGVLETKID